LLFATPFAEAADDLRLKLPMFHFLSRRTGAISIRRLCCIRINAPAAAGQPAAASASRFQRYAAPSFAASVLRHVYSRQLYAATLRFL